MMRWQRAATAAPTPLGLTHTQFRMLTSIVGLHEHDRVDPSQREVAAHVGADAMVTSQVVRTLERAGYVVRVDDAHDARVRRLQVTEAGRELAFEAITLIEQLDREFFGIGHDGGTAIATLRRLAGRDADGRLTDPRWPRST